MDKISQEQLFLSRKKAALKNVFSALLVLNYYGDEGEFMSLNRAARKHFELYNISEPKPEARGNVYDLNEYRIKRETT